ncbi:MAG: hypothetical protein COS82_11715 [Zetaproteobacteria bacterium CG06_land_8_20_14_3_00_59_53]|nr:MAG: hypothetical protein COX56_04920 [Zetaproteobacteria bacterium CG23_combo_of_CG06-09_8_20_14_all_59_86]PIQ64870.1 MAG: hypothetical protein COV97_07390 [Zetaproteobacteria bacterium CG11_big_fil_rev_8_21_14_0_20_59_439]PIU69549.1 MAG: hypothetical protein COS82_11715 [Zetaproteobacteria bacterium CG06_land_8_20_14_3_00_59_53]PIU96697.1 MAG: hypothetical protein COS62_06685 [Zetaproteobacteria bacterium CG03_land_8_20_14_0_80_59_51]PIY46879.1 MAG: hypothetical protein COZ02_04665 [Zetapr
MVFSGSAARIFGLLLCSVFWLSLAGSVEAAGANDRNLRKIVLDQTTTYPGHEFYRYFVPLLSEKVGNVYFDSVTLKESRSKRSGSLISIEYREAILFQTVVYAADQYINAKAIQAAAVVSAKLSQSQLDGLLSQGGDLAGDEL